MPNILIQLLQLLRAVLEVEVVPPTTDNRIEFPDYFLWCQMQHFPFRLLMDLLPHRFHGLLSRPHIRDKSMGRSGLAFVEVKTKKVEPFAVHIHNAGLGGMEG